MCKKSIFSLCSLLGFTILTAYAQPAASEVVLEEGTLVSLRLEEAIRSGEAQRSDIVPLVVGINVVAQGQMVINTGAYAEARVTRVVPAKKFGKGGFLEVEVINVQLVDGQRIELAGDPKVKEGRNRKFLAWAVAILAPGTGMIFAASTGNTQAVPFILPFAGLGFLVKGREAEIQANEILLGRVTRDVTVQLE